MTSDQEQRSGFQFELYKLNIIVNGAIIAFCLSDLQSWGPSPLLACPFISLILFMLWAHHGIAIKMDSEARKKIERRTTGHEAKDPIHPKRYQRLREITFSASILTNFALLPSSAIAIYWLKANSVMIYVAIFSIVIIIVLFFVWFSYQYRSHKKARGIAKNSDATPSAREQE